MSDDLITFGEPELQVDGTSYRFQWMRDGQPMMGVLVEDVHSDGDRVMGGFTVWWLYDQPLGVRPIQPYTVLNLASSHSTGWRSIPRELSRRITNVDWEGALTIAVSDVLDRFRSGDPTIDLSTETAPRETPFILEPWISAAGSTVLYGEGGLSKSLIALAMSLSVSTGVPIFGKEPTTVGPVMYFDYEDDHYTHVNRLVALCRAFGIPQSEARVHYHALTSKVSQAKREMAKRANEVGAVLGVLDSVGMGRGGSAVAAEDTIRMFRGLREVGIPFLTIDHVSKEAKDKKGGDVDAYGSIYTMNSARLAWSLTRQHTGKPEDIHIHAINRKANHVRKAPPQTIALRYHNDERGVPERIDIETGNEFGFVMSAVGAHERVQMHLMGTGNEFMTYAELEEQLGIPAPTIRSMVSRDGGATFETESAPGKATRVRCCTNHATPLATPLSEEVEDDETQ